jgi:hypothetical protein
MQKSTEDLCPHCQRRAIVLATYPGQALQVSASSCGFKMFKCPRGHYFTVTDKVPPRYSGRKLGRPVKTAQLA